MSDQWHSGAWYEDRLKRQKPISRRATPAPAPDADVRPIGARALKSLIDTLRFSLHGARVLDLYAGQGRIGLAALEAGADSVVFVEKSVPVAGTLRAVIEKKKVSATVITGDALSYLDRLTTEVRFSLIFADPPFPEWRGSYAKKLFERAARHSPSWLVVKHPSREAIPEAAGFSLWRETKFGESRLLYYRMPADAK